MPSSPPSHATLLAKTEIHALYSWPQQMFDGTVKEFSCVVRPDTSAVIPFLDRETVLVTKQEHPGRPAFYDFPGGRVDEGETAEQTAHRELFEETSYHAGKIECVYSKKRSGTQRYEVNVFLATGLVRSDGIHYEQDGEKIEVIPMNVREVERMIFAQSFRDPQASLVFLSLFHDATMRARLDAFLGARA